MSTRTELNTITSSLSEISSRITALVESDGPQMDSDVYSELVAAERTIGALLRRLNRAARNV
ncbi:MAG: hypothetical protein HKL85_04800 [Acidimicrobiaceae bacterium]|nr:hypothetical protein [Acidimicrobiaceae bacterium]